MGYYGTDIEDTEASFDDPTDALEAGAAADAPEGDLGDGLRRRKRIAEGGDWDPDLIRRSHEKKVAGW